jgi:HSP20 family protein
MYGPTSAWWTSEPVFEIRRLQRDVNRLFGDYWAESEPFPTFNVWTNSDEAVLKAEVPGVDPKTLDISANGDQVSVSGVRKAEEIEKDVVCHRAERDTGQFTRTLRMPFPIETGKVSAKYRHGVLTVTLPRAEASKPRKIAITAES